MSYAELTAVPKLVVGEKDIRSNEYVTYIASLDEESVQRARYYALWLHVGVFLFLLIHLNPCAIIICCYFASTVHTYSDVMKRWELYVTERSLCYVNPYAPQGMDFFSIPLAHIASVNTRRMSELCAKVPAIEVTLKQRAPPITIKRRGRLVTPALFVSSLCKMQIISEMFLGSG